MVAGAETGGRDWLSTDTRELLEVMRLVLYLDWGSDSATECICLIHRTL